MDPFPYASSIGGGIRNHQHFPTPITLHGRSLLWLILRTSSTTIPNNATSKTDLWKTFASNSVLLSIKKKLVISKACVNQDPLEPQQIFLFEQTEYYRLSKQFYPPNYKVPSTHCNGTIKSAYGNESKQSPNKEPDSHLLDTRNQYLITCLCDIHASNWAKY